MSEQEQTLINEEDKKRVENAFFAKSVKLLPNGVLVNAVNLDKKEIDTAISNADIADIYNAINGESPFDGNEQ